MKAIWIIGCPRSGTTFLTSCIGKHTDYCFNEPWNTHTLHDTSNWKFPECNSFVFKYCANWKNIFYLKTNFPNSIYIHTIRNPINVVHSMAFPKQNSVPKRILTCLENKPEERIKNAITAWETHIIGCLWSKNYVEHINIIYENINWKLLENKLDIPIDYSKEFHNRNLEDVDPEQIELIEKFWRLPEFNQCMQLRNEIETMIEKENKNEPIDDTC